MNKDTFAGCWSGQNIWTDRTDGSKPEQGANVAIYGTDKSGTLWAVALTKNLLC